MFLRSCGLQMFPESGRLRRSAILVLEVFLVLRSAHFRKLVPLSDVAGISSFRSGCLRLRLGNSQFQSAMPFRRDRSVTAWRLSCPSLPGFLSMMGLQRRQMELPMIC
jgi:hypothetical protein